MSIHVVDNVLSMDPEPDDKDTDDDTWSAQFKDPQKVLNKEILCKEAKLSSSKAKQTVLDLTSLAKRTLTGEMKIVESKTHYYTVSKSLYENALAFNVANAPRCALHAARRAHQRLGVHSSS
jgi:hypothetical protein